MIGQIIDVEYDDGTTKIAKITGNFSNVYEVICLRKVNEHYMFSEVPTEIPKESVSGFYDATRLEDTGLFTKVDDVHYETVDTSDSDYVYDSEYTTDIETSVYTETSEEEEEF